MKQILTAEHLRQIISYDPDTGLWMWLERKRKPGRGGPPKKEGWWPGGFGQHGKYYQIAINRRVYPVHRLAWFWMTGQWPPEETDHIDGDTTNNRWTNLRLANHSQNQRNVAVRKDNRLGARGVRLTPNGTYEARIRRKGKTVQIGTFKTLEEATRAREAMAQVESGLFYRRLA